MNPIHGETLLRSRAEAQLRVDKVSTGIRSGQGIEYGTLAQEVTELAQATERDNRPPRTILDATGILRCRS